MTIKQSINRQQCTTS